MKPEKPPEIFGFKWIPGTISLNAVTYTLALAYKEPIETKIGAWHDLLHQFDTPLRMRPTRFYESDDPRVVLVDVDAGWTKTPILISAFSTLVRLGFTYPAGLGATEFFTQARRNKYTHTVNSNDVYRLSTLQPRLERLLTGFVPKLGYENLSSLGEAHMTGVALSPVNVWQ